MTSFHMTSFICQVHVCICNISKHILYDKFSYDKFYFTGVNVSTSLLLQVFFVDPYRRAKFVL